MPVNLFVMLTDTPGTTAWPASVTVPEINPRVSCARAGLMVEANTRVTAIHTVHRWNFNINEPSLGLRKELNSARFTFKIDVYAESRWKGRRCARCVEVGENGKFRNGCLNTEIRSRIFD